MALLAIDCDDASLDGKQTDRCDWAEDILFCCVPLPNKMNQDKIDIHFSCQRCCLPLSLHTTMGNVKISPETIRDLTSKYATKRKSKATELEESLKTSHLKPSQQSFKDNTKNESVSPSTKMDLDLMLKTVVPLRSKVKSKDLDSNANGELKSSGGKEKKYGFSSAFDPSYKSNKSKNGYDLKMQTQLFDILSDQSDIDHPLCEECANFVIDQMKSQLNSLEKECTKYSIFIEKEANQQDQITEEELDEMQIKVEALENVQKNMIKELKQLNKVQKSLEDEYDKQKSDLIRLKHDENKYWHEYNNVKFNLFKNEQEQMVFDNKIKYGNEFYNRLKKTNMFNLAFYISWVAPCFVVWLMFDACRHNDNLGSINGFRMGRSENGVPIEWTEINAGFGQCALLLTSLAAKTNLTFQKFKIIPYGNFSFIESIDDKSKQYPL